MERILGEPRPPSTQEKPEIRLMIFIRFPLAVKTNIL